MIVPTLPGGVVLFATESDCDLDGEGPPASATRIRRMPTVMASATSAMRSDLLLVGPSVRGSPAHGGFLCGVSPGGQGVRP